jgi:hypothetical protein
VDGANTLMKRQSSLSLGAGVLYTLMEKLRLVSGSAVRVFVRGWLVTVRWWTRHDLQENCCMQDGPLFFVWSGSVHGSTFCAGAKRLGGAAKGIPRNWETVVEASGRYVGIPTITPASIVAVGYKEEALATLLSNERVVVIRASVCGEYIVVAVVSGWA